MLTFSRRLFLLLAVITSSFCTETHIGSFLKRELSTLNASPFQRFRVLSSIDCALRCVRNESCLSFNMASTSNREDGLRLCEILNVDIENSPQLLSESPRFHHYSRVWGPCEKHKCLNNARCTVNAMATGYYCECQPGFMGVSCESVKWIKLNTKEVSFGAKDNQFGPFNITKPGELFTIKLVWKSGYITTQKDHIKTRSHWYSNDRNTGAPDNKLGVIITNTAKKRILPLNKDVISGSHEYYLPGYNSMSPYIIYKNFTSPYKVTAGQEFQIWFSQDIEDAFEESNDGTCYVDVYGLYV